MKNPEWRGGAPDQPQPRLARQPPSEQVRRCPIRPEVHESIAADVVVHVLEVARPREGRRSEALHDCPPRRHRFRVDVLILVAVRMERQRGRGGLPPGVENLTAVCPRA